MEALYKKRKLFSKITNFFNFFIKVYRVEEFFATINHYHKTLIFTEGTEVVFNLLLQIKNRLTQSATGKSKQSSSIHNGKDKIT